MPETTFTPNSDVTPEPTSMPEAKSHFSKAVEEAKAGASALGKEAQGRAEEYREKMNQTKDDWAAEARARTEEARGMAYDYASEGKAKASHAIAGLGKLVEENAAVIDDKVGAKYGDYARSAARTIQEGATKLDEKSLEQLADDAREFVRESPMLAVGMAATAGFVLARLFKGK